MAEPDAEAVPRAEADDLDVLVIPGCKTALCGARSTVRTLIRIKTPAAEHAVERPKVQVACVLDRSGSMAGQKLSFAKKACAKLAKHLSEGDVLHFIAYDHDVRVVFQSGDLSETGKEDLKTQIHQVRPGGATNLFGGLEAAAGLLDGEGVRRIFLFSDGRVNSGLTDQGQICARVAAWAQQGITTTTFGIGADFDEPLMRGIAEAGKGRYTFLANAPDIPRLVSKSIHDLLKLYGSEAVLDVRGGTHTVVDRVYGGDEEDSEAAGGLLNLGDLHESNERMALLELAASPAGDTAPGQSFQAAHWTLTFQRRGCPVQFSGSLTLVTSHQRPAEEDPAVRAMFALRQASNLEQEVASHLQERNLAAARDAKTRQLLLLSQTLEAVQGVEGVEEVYVQSLQRVYERAQRVAEQLNKDDEDMEIARRHCVHECDLTRAMSVTGWSDGVDSSGSPADLQGRDLDEVSLPSSNSSCSSLVRPPRPSQPPVPQTAEAEPAGSAEPAEPPREEPEPPAASRCACM